jgi:hypothetical protein
LFSEVIFPIEPGKGSTAKAFAADQCNVVAGGLGEVSLANETAGGEYDFVVSSRYTYEIIEPLALVTRQDDPQWSDFVHTIVTATFFADENRITMATALSDMPEMYLYGAMYSQMLRHAIHAVGSYSEIYGCNIPVPQSGLNSLYNKNSTTPLLFSVQDLRTKK